MNQEEFDYFYKSILFQKEIEKMETIEKLNYIISTKEGFNFKYSYFQKKLLAKIAEENIYEMEIEESLMKSLEDASEEELDEVRDNIINALLATREELYIKLLIYIESEEFFDTENDNSLFLIRPTAQRSLSISIMENINHSFYDYNQNNNLTSTKIFEEEDEEEGAFVIHGVDIEYQAFIGDFK